MLTRIAACLTLAFICNVAAAQDVNQWARNLQGRLAALQGPIDEGEDDNRNQWGTGSVNMTNVVKRGTSDRVGNGVVNAIRRQNGQVINTKAFLDAFDADLNKKGIEVTGDLQPTKIDEREETDAGTDE